jgi:hypothetical protein
MKSLLVQLDEPTFHAINRIAPAGRRQTGGIRTIRHSKSHTGDGRTHPARIP